MLLQLTSEHSSQACCSRSTPLVTYEVQDGELPEVQGCGAGVPAVSRAQGAVGGGSKNRGVGFAHEPPSFGRVGRGGGCSQPCGST